MDYAKPGFWIAILVGGAIVATLSAIQQYTTAESTSFTFRPVFRDFFLGSFVTASIYMFLPESFDSMISEMPSLSSLPSMPSMSSMTGAGGASVDSIELQTGPARF
jgi:hypothetical protein